MKRSIVSTLLIMGGINITSFADDGDANNVYRINEKGSRQFYEMDTSSVYSMEVKGGKSVKLAKKPENLKSYKAEYRAKKKEMGKNLGIAFYPKGHEKKDSLRRVLRDRMMLELEKGQDVEAMSKALGARNFKILKRGESVKVVFTFNDAVEVLDKLDQAKSVEGILSVKPLLSKNVKKMTTTPTDPRFAYSVANPNYQWHLWNTGENGGTAGIDVNIRDVWDSYTGDGVIIAVADDGLEINHPDLIGNTTGMVHYNWVYDKADPTPEIGETDSHGTSVGGVSAASWFNGVGGTGSAPEAGLVGLRWLVFNQDFSPTVVDIAEVLGWGQSFGTDLGAADIDIHNNSWGPSHPTFLAPMEDEEEEAIVDGIENGRGGLGTIYTFAAGNDRENDGNANYGGYVASRYTIGIGAINDLGVNSSYSNPGSALIISAPSDGDVGRQGITTTELQSLGSGYTDTFGGTSSATPLTSGIIALMLEANPALGWRDVQEILIASARQIDASDSDWQINGNGYHFNHRYGAGMVDAEAAVNLAQVWVNLEEETSVSVNLNGLDQDIPDNGSTEVVLDFTELDNKRVENVLVTLDIDHIRRQDLECVLISPNGTQSRLTESFTGGDTENGISYTFLSTFNWGEDSFGEWTLRVFDRVGSVSGNIDSVEVEVFGVDRDPETPPVIVDASSRIGFLVDSTVDHEYNILFPGTSTLSRGDLPTGLTFDAVNNKIVGTPTETGVWFIEFDFTNNYGTTTLPVRIAIGEGPADSIADAIERSADTVNLEGLYGSFAIELEDIPDGSDSIVSLIDIPDGTSGLPISPYGEAHVSFQQTSGGIVMFDWKVNSSEAVDRFWFSPSSTTTAISGWHGFMSDERDWGTFASPLPDDGSTVRWSFVENQSGLGGGGYGALDQVKIYTHEEYSNMLTEFSGSDLTFNTDNRALWVPTYAYLPVDVAADLSQVLQASAIGNAQFSDLVSEVEGPGVVTFYWKTSSEQKDRLQFIVAGTLREQIAGDTGWTKVSVTIPEGSYPIRWRFLKDSRDSADIESAMVAGVEFTELLTYEEWAAGNFSEDQLADSSISGETADPNNNGLSNLLEYAFGGDPLVNISGAVLPELIFAAEAEEPSELILFADTFERGNNTNLNASTDGKSGTLGALTYSSSLLGTTLDIFDGSLRIDDGLVYPDYNFMDASILASGKFNLEVDISNFDAAENGQMSISLGQSLSDLLTQVGADPASHDADLTVAYRGGGGLVDSLVVSEPFDYTNDLALAGLNGGTGFDGAWVTTNGTGPELLVNATSLPSGPLTTSGGSIDRSVNTNFTTSNRTLSASAVTSLTADGTTLWGSFLYRDGVVVGNNPDSSFVIGSDPLLLGNNHQITSGAVGFGITIGEFNTINTDAVIYGGAGTAPTVAPSTGITDADIINTTTLFLFSVEWNPDGTDDVITFYSFDVNDTSLTSDLLSGTLPVANISSISFDFTAAQQASFDTLSIIETQGGEFDEIRLGATIGSVLPGTAFENNTVESAALEIYNNGIINNSESVVGGIPEAPTTMRIECTVPNFSLGSAVSYSVFFDNATTPLTSGSFNWSGNNENYVSLASNLTADGSFDNLRISTETVPVEDPFDFENDAFFYQINTSLSDIEYTLETSTDLSTWTEVSGELFSTDGVYQTYRFDLIPSDTDPRRFMRVRVNK